MRRIISKFVCFNFRKYCNLSESVWLCHGESWYMDNTYLYAQFWLHSIFSSHLCWFLSPVWFLSMLTFAHVCSTGKLPFDGIQVFWWPFLTVNDIHSLSWWMLAYRHTKGGRWLTWFLTAKSNYGDYGCLWHIYIIIYLYIQYTSVISLWGKATCIMFAGPRSLGQGYHFSSHLGGIWK